MYCSDRFSEVLNGTVVCCVRNNSVRQITSLEVDSMSSRTLLFPAKTLFFSQFVLLYLNFCFLTYFMFSVKLSISPN